MAREKAKFSGILEMTQDRQLIIQFHVQYLVAVCGSKCILLQFHVPPILWGAGLENLGNTCFFNSVLQCLTFTEPLVAYLQSGKHQNSCRTAGFCALCAIQKHVSRALQLTGRSLAPKDLVSNLQCISRNFRNARQEDAHEYMVNLLESMHKCCLPAGVPCESPSAYEKSLVHEIFGGFLGSQVKCIQCSFCSNKFDPFLDLSLEIITAESLYQTLLHFTAKEYLDGGEKQYQCQRCKQKVKALKQLTIHKAPYVLTIHLKRFGTHQPGQKIDKKIQFGPTLDLKPFVSGPCVHTSSGMWYSLDDHQVCQVSEKTVLEQKAYMLFYVQDRRNFASKKLVDVVQKESMVINAMGNKTLSNFNQGLKEIVQNRPIDKRVDSVDSSDKTSQKIDNEVSLQEHDENAFQKIDSLMSSNWLSCENSQESALDDCGPSMGVIELEDLSSPGMIHMSLHQETLDLKPQRKLKRKLQKCQCSPTDLQPSTSERTMTSSLGGTVHSQRKGLKCGSSLKDNSAVANNVKSSNYDSVQEGIFHEEFRDKLGENGSKESRTDSLENGFISTLTRGLEETIGNPTSFSPFAVARRSDGETVLTSCRSTLDCRFLSPASNISPRATVLGKPAHGLGSLVTTRTTTTQHIGATTSSVCLSKGSVSRPPKRLKRFAEDGFFPETRITAISVGDEVLTTIPSSFPLLVIAIKFLYTALVDSNLHTQIKISSPHAASIVLDPFPPSQAFFNQSLTQFVLPWLQFLS
ncbi:hypothetical protein TEA_024125 [Camellia sinensis var. sinensis]|uniref:USP domain-containing protein n=1 Tax=Camellia sinensis var. sinensis TaxID=542762 RepID=A0A4S4E2D0_CAMSN|nr:hypothetical protein TEA_024125 [Camellia sinensis var. sinensis]